jgi:hypothetical protein
MHSTRFQIDGYEGDVVVHHNGDWSGEAIIVFKEKVFGTWDKQKKPEQEVEIPAKLLAALALPAAQEMMQYELQRFADRLPEILRIRAKIGPDDEGKKRKEK